MAIHENHKKTFSMWSEVRTNSTNIIKSVIMISQNDMTFSLLTIFGLGALRVFADYLKKVQLIFTNLSDFQDN